MFWLTVHETEVDIHNLFQTYEEALEEGRKRMIGALLRGHKITIEDENHRILWDSEQISKEDSIWLQKYLLSPEDG